MERVRQFGRYFMLVSSRRPRSYSVLDRCTFSPAGSTNSPATSKIDSAPEASLVYDRHDNLVFSFASGGSHERSSRPRVEHDGLGGAHCRGSLLLQACGDGHHRSRAGRVGRLEGARGQAGRQHHYPAAHPSGGVDDRSQLSSARSKKRCWHCGSSAGSTRKKFSRRTSIASTSATVTTVSRRRPEATSGSRPPSSTAQKARCLPASFRALPSVHRERRRTSPDRGATRC